MIWNELHEKHQYCKSYEPSEIFYALIEERYKNSSYIVKHWHGKLSLGVSYWVNNVLLHGVVTILFVFLTDIDFTDDNTSSYLIVILLWIFSMIMSPWVLVGLWRSATNHIKKYNIKFWGNVVRIMVVVGWYNVATSIIEVGIPQVFEFTKIMLAIDDIPPYKIKTLNEGREIKISGGIRFGLTNEMKKYFDKNPNIELVHLDSIGGRISEARKLSKYLDSKKISTYVSNKCHSACIDIFLGGKYRIINSQAKLGFHQPSFPGLTEEDLKVTLDVQKQYYVNQGVSVYFVDKAFLTPSEDLWEAPINELRDSGVIDKIADLNDMTIAEARAIYNVRDKKSTLRYNRDVYGFYPDGFDGNGYDKYGYLRNGFSRNGFNREGINKITQTQYNENGFNVHGYNKDGLNIGGFNKDGLSQNGYNQAGFDKNGIHQITKVKYDPKGIDMDGYNKLGFNNLGFTRLGINKDGYDIDGFKNGYNRNGYDIKGYDKYGLDVNGEK